MKVKISELYVIVTINNVDFYFDRSRIDDKGYLDYDGWGGNVEGKPHLLVKEKLHSEGNVKDA